MEEDRKKRMLFEEVREKEKEETQQRDKADKHEKNL